LTRQAAAQRLGIGVVDLADVGRPWTARDVVDVPHGRPEWLRSGRKALGVAGVEGERQRKARLDAVLVRRSGCEYPAVSGDATAFARAFAKANLLAFRHDAPDASGAAESELVGDLLAIVTGWAGRLYGRRSAKSKRLRAAVAAPTASGDAA
jgi:hypothetical protein